MKEKRFLGRFIYFGAISFIAAVTGLLRWLSERPEGIEFMTGGFFMLLIVYLYDTLNKEKK